MQRFLHVLCFIMWSIAGTYNVVSLIVRGNTGFIQIATAFVSCGCAVLYLLMIIMDYRKGKHDDD